MNITPISMARANAIQTSKPNKVQYVNDTLNDSVNFTGKNRKSTNGFVRAVSGVLAALGIATVAAPTAHAFTPAPTSGYVETMPLPMPTIVKEDIESADSNYVDLSNYNTSSYEYAQMPIEERLEELLPEANRIQENEDMLFAQMKQISNITVLMDEAARARSAMREAGRGADELQEKLENASNKAEVLAVIAELNSREAQAKAYASAIEQAAYETAQDVAQRASQLSRPSSVPVPPVQNPVYPNIDSFEDIFGYGEYMRDYVYGLIPNYDSMSVSERNAILSKEAARVRQEAQEETQRAQMLQFITEQVNASYQRDRVGTKTLVSDMTMRTASSRKTAETLNIVASRLEGIVSGSYKLLPQYPPLPSGTIPKEETTNTSDELPSVPSKPKDEVIGCTYEDIFGITDVPSSVPTPLPPTEPPVIGCSYEDIFGKPQPPTPVPTPEPPLIGCTFEDIFGMTYEEYQNRYGEKLPVEISE